MASSEKVTDLFDGIHKELSKVVVGRKEVIKFLFVALLSEGHVLLEGVPGIAKTLTAKVFAKSLGLDFRRIQFTPDMLPADVMGTYVFDQKKQDFTFRAGPVFSNLILADEINRAPPKTQSSLLEAMQETQVTVEGNTRKLARPFLVIATQNPIEQEGTYLLPEAQLDRFMFRLIVDYPSREEGIGILESITSGSKPDDISKVAGAKEIQSAKDSVASVHVSKEVIEYIVSLIEATRNDSRRIVLGGSPRASVHLLTASKSIALLNGRDYVIPDDIKEVAFEILNHRLILKPEYLIETRTKDSLYHYPELRKTVGEIVSTVQPP